MADQVSLDRNMAIYIAEKLLCLADLADPNTRIDRENALSHLQRSLLTFPPARAAARYPDDMAKRMREVATALVDQIPREDLPIWKGWGD
jgi:hypothetical protein